MNRLSQISNKEAGIGILREDRTADIGMLQYSNHEVLLPTFAGEPNNNIHTILIDQKE